MHQCLIQWVDDAIEIVSADSSFSVASAEAHIASYDRMNCLSGQAWEQDFFRMADYEIASMKAGDSSVKS
jgi:hypothetical protein